MQFKTLLAGSVGAFLATAGIGYGALTMGSAKAQQRDPDIICAGTLKVNFQNPNTNRYDEQLVARLSMRGNRSEMFRAVLESQDGSQYETFIQFNGQSMAMVTDLGPNAETIYGMGVARYDPGDCRGGSAGMASSIANSEQNRFIERAALWSVEFNR